MNEQETTETPDASVQDGEGSTAKNSEASQNSVEQTSEDSVKQKEIAENQKIRAEKAEAELKELRERIKSLEGNPQPKETSKPQESKPAQNDLSKDEVILYAKGLTDEQVEYAKKIASLEGCSIVGATETDLYKTWQATNQTRLEKEQAQLEASQGAGEVVKKKGFNQRMTAEEHQAAWRESMGL